MTPPQTQPMKQHPPTAPPRGFTAAEFESRTIGAQRLMAERGIDALLLTTEPEVRYFTGFLTQFWQSPTRPWFLIIPSSGKPVAVIPAIGAEPMNGTWLDDVRTWASPCPEDEGVSLLAETLTELAGSDFCLGIPEGPETHLRMPLADYRRLRGELPSTRIVDATEIVKTLRMVKSEAEVKKIAHVCDLISTVFESLPEHLRYGMTEIEVFRHFKIAALEQGVDDIPYLVGGAGPGGYRSIISPPTTRPIEPGDVLILDTGALFDGYSCDFDRNYAFGTATAASREAYELVFEATDAGFAAARPGATCAEVFLAMQRVLAKDDDQRSDVGRMGHGLGMQLTEWPSNTALDNTELLPGMVLTLEPSTSYGDGMAMVHEENILIEEDGARYLSRRAAPQLPIVGEPR